MIPWRERESTSSYLPAGDSWHEPEWDPLRSSAPKLTLVLLLEKEHSSLIANRNQMKLTCLKKTVKQKVQFISREFREQSLKTFEAERKKLKRLVYLT
jgi:hypothetical protein